MGTAEKGFMSWGKGLRESKRPSVLDSDFPSTTPQIEQEKAAVESGKDKGGSPQGDTAQVKKYGK